jgi:hypothetical protein
MALTPRDIRDQYILQTPPGEPDFDVVERKHINVSDLRDGAKLKTVFKTIYRTNHWGSAETRSGPGSERTRVKQMASELGELIRKLNVKSVLDAPCGDFNWMQDVSLDEEVSYLGCDIVKKLIRDNRRRHGRPQRSFRVLDFTVGPVPRADLILCRDALVHLSDRHILTALELFRASDSKYLLTTTFQETPANDDIRAGWWRPINLQLPPFNLPDPLLSLSDMDSDDLYEDKVLALWDLQELTWQPH